MPPENDKDDLRSAISEAFDAQESAATAADSQAGGSAANAEEPVRTTAPTERSEPVGDGAPADGTPTTDKPEPVSEPVATESAAPDKGADRAPESWRPTTREHWGKLPPEVKQEVMKRETEMNQFVQKTAAQRKIADQFVGVMQPFMGMIQAEGGNPVQTVQNLLNTAAFLRTGPVGQKAQMVAKMIKDYGIDIQMLDAALAGEVVPATEEDRLGRIIEQRLAPVNDFIKNIQGMRSQREQRVDGEIDTEISTFANDPANEFFKEVYEDMADMIEIAAKRGGSMNMKTAYDRACRDNPEIQKILEGRATAKKAASGSLPLRGAGSTGKPAEGDDLRSDILRAFDQTG